MPQLRVHMLQLKILSAATKTNQINKQKWLRSVVVWGLPWWFSGKEAAHSSGVVVRSLSCVWLFATPWTAACQASLSFTISWSLHKLMSIESVMLSNHFILCCPLVLSVFPRISLSQRVSSSHQVGKILKLHLQHQFFLWILRVDFLQDWLDWSPCCPRDSQESPPASQFESTSSSALSLLYGSEGMATHSSILAWRIPWTEETDGLQSMGLQKVGHNMTEQLSTFFFKENKVLLIEAHQYTDTC